MSDVMARVPFVIERLATVKHNSATAAEAVCVSNIHHWLLASCGLYVLCSTWQKISQPSQANQFIEKPNHPITTHPLEVTRAKAKSGKRKIVSCVRSKIRDKMTLQYMNHMSRDWGDRA